METVHDIPILPARPADGHKGTFGKAAILGGSAGMAGAVGLAGNAALVSGVGLVRLAVPKSIQSTVTVLCPCATSTALKDADGLIGAGADEVIGVLNENDAAGVGPGMGRHKHLQKMLCAVLEKTDMPVVIDADGLNNLAAMGTDGCEALKDRAVLTPHPGEFARLWAAWMGNDTMPKDRAGQAAELAKKTQAVVVLKGYGTVISDGEKVRINDTGNNGMATGGSGDVLTGIIAALLAGRGYNGLSLFDAASLGVWIHGRAGDLAAQQWGAMSMTATHLCEALAGAWKAYCNDR